MNKRNLILLICLLSLSTAVGCGPSEEAIEKAIDKTQESAEINTPEPSRTPEPTDTPTSEPSPTPTPVWEKFEGGGIELWLPESYEGGNPLDDIEVIVEVLRGLGPDYEQMAQDIEQNPSMFILWAFDSKVGDSGFLTNVNVGKEKVSSDITMDTYLDLGLNGYPPQFQVVERGIVSLGDYQAGRWVIEITYYDVVVKQLFYAVKDGINMWVFVYSTGAEEFDQRLPEFEQSALTFFILDSCSNLLNEKEQQNCYTVEEYFEILNMRNGSGMSLVTEDLLPRFFHEDATIIIYCWNVTRDSNDVIVWCEDADYSGDYGERFTMLVLYTSWGVEPTEYSIVGDQISGTMAWYEDESREPPFFEFPFEMSLKDGKIQSLIMTMAKIGDKVE